MENNKGNAYKTNRNNDKPAYSAGSLRGVEFLEPLENEYTAKITITLQEFSAKNVEHANRLISEMLDLMADNDLELPLSGVEWVIS